MNGVMRFGKKEKFSPCYVGLYEVLNQHRSFSYEFKFKNKLSMIHLVFHVFMLQKCTYHLISILPLEGLGCKRGPLYEEVPVEILDCQVKKLWNKEVLYVKAIWTNHLIEGACHIRVYPLNLTVIVVLLKD